MKIGSGSFGSIYRKGKNALKVSYMSDGDPVQEVEGLLEKAMMKFVGDCPNTVSLSSDKPVCLKTTDAPFEKCYPDAARDDNYVNESPKRIL